MREGFEVCGTFWSGVECEVEGKNKEIKKKKSRGTCVEEVARKERKKGNKEKKNEGMCVEEKKRGKKRRRKYGKKIK